ncbi:putative nucleotide-binding alpha-beta plait domain superfamily, RNA-binding domain superfamily [Arabidopsis thaliana]
MKLTVLFSINFFKVVATVVHVRIGVNHNGKPIGYGLVEFASANEAKKVRVVNSNDKMYLVI